MKLSTTLLTTLSIMFSAATADGNLRANTNNAQGITEYETSYSADRSIRNFEERDEGDIGHFDIDTLPILLVAERELAAADEEPREIVETNIDDQEREEAEDRDDDDDDDDDEDEDESKMFALERRNLGRKHKRHKKSTHKKNKYWCYKKCTKHGRWHGECDHKCHGYCKKYWRHFCQY